MFQNVRRRLATTALLLAPFAAAPAFAQSPTPEGTPITNTATATFTDANGNTYSSVSASVTVTVGFLAGVDVSSAASVTPASPSTGNFLPFTLGNIGNGTDQLSVSTTIGAGVSVTGYRYAGTIHNTLADLNLALAAVNVPMGGAITVELRYDVAPGYGGQTIPVTLTANSIRTPATGDASTTNVIPPVAAAVDVTPDAATANRLPSNGTQYTQDFTVQNPGNASDTYALAASLVPGGALTIVSVNGTAGASSAVTVAAGASAVVTVVYTVGNVAAGTTDQLRLVATSGNDNSVSNMGDLTVTVIRAALTMAKEAFRDNQTTAITAADRVLPGEFIWYRITVTNAGGASASTVSVSDALPAQVTYVSTAGDAAGWTISESAGTVTASLAGTLDPSGSRFFWVRVQIK